MHLFTCYYRGYDDRIHKFTARTFTIKDMRYIAALRKNTVKHIISINKGRDGDDPRAPNIG